MSTGLFEYICNVFDKTFGAFLFKYFICFTGIASLAYIPDCQQLRLPTFLIANSAIAYKQLFSIFKN